ncbi:DgyrCDS2352 [Dimorphilus gyrociliatus]|uniref:DgyrCDS2352 n=1 Tax=Dimorphilus gyrociliatus TaxID=2664684 RepID=A0A7I8VF56_9ANNE|nr:DgyrCDS2352 [Dimorphilus gyrociliatus]
MSGTINNGSSTPTSVGFIGAGVAVIFFGSNFVPLKKFETGDGLFFQWILCIAIWHVGLVVNAIRKFPIFYPLAMVGGTLWCSGNVLTVFIIKTIGLGQGFLIWGMSNLIFGWVSARFGWFGIKEEIPQNQVMNFCGVGLALVSTVIYIFIKSETNGRIVRENDGREPLLPHDQSNVQTIEHQEVDETITRRESLTFVDRISSRNKRLLGILAALYAGSMYGLSFTPVIYIQDRYDGASDNGLDYVFAYFTGILATSTLFMFIYCIFMKNKPRVYPKAILPGIISGIMWGIADAGWFIANKVLSAPISFPIITTAPPLIGVLWGTLVFKEIRGKKNYALLILAGLITIAGAVLTGLSKGD